MEKSADIGTLFHFFGTNKSMINHGIKNNKEWNMGIKLKGQIRLKFSS